nr:MAG TPA: hypothetical protein [Caudoviricetes sp.]
MILLGTTLRSLTQRKQYLHLFLKSILCNRMSLSRS